MNAKEKIPQMKNVCVAFSQRYTKTYGRLRGVVWFEEDREISIKEQNLNSSYNYINNKGLNRIKKRTKRMIYIIPIWNDIRSEFGYNGVSRHVSIMKGK